MEIGGSVEASVWTAKHPCMVDDFKINYAPYSPTTFRGYFVSFRE